MMRWLALKISMPDFLEHNFIISLAHDQGLVWLPFDVLADGTGARVLFAPESTREPTICAR
jgi:hypothetical protein